MAAATSSLPLVVVLLLLLLVASAAPAAAGMVIVRRRGSGTRVLGGGDARDANTNSKWRYHGRLLEEELGGMLLLGGGEGSIGYGALDKDRPGCQSSSQCAGKGVGSYTRPCTYKDHCPQ